MRKVLRWAAGVTAGLLLVIVVLFAVSRLRGPTPDQRAALALLREEARPVGRNAFAAMWLLPYDVPESEQEKVAAEDVSRFSSLTGDFTEGFPIFESIASSRYPSLKLPESEKGLLCDVSSQGCLAHVRKHRDAISSLMQKHRRLLERADGLAKYSYLHSAFPVRLDTPFVTISANEGSRLARTRDAFNFAEGRPFEALQGICGRATTWRQVIRKPDILVDQMIGVAIVGGATFDFAEILSALPVDYPLPDRCAEAFALAAPSELSACAVMRGEFSYSQAITGSLHESQGSMNPLVRKILLPIVFDREMTRSLMAQNYAWPCTRGVQDQVVRDTAVSWPPPASMLRLECVGNAVGCMLASIGASPYDSYQQRLQDHGARLKLVGTLLWLRKNADDDRPLEAQISTRPVELQSTTRDIEIVKDEALRIRQFDTSRGAFWQLPLASYLADHGRN